MQLEDGTVRRRALTIVGFAEIRLCRNTELTVTGSERLVHVFPFANPAVTGVLAC